MRLIPVEFWVIILGMILPYADRAVVDIRKLRDYCLNIHHDEGKHKARVFIAALGMTDNDAEALRGMVLEVLKSAEARLKRRDMFGQRYEVDFVANWQGKRAVIRSGWIVEHQYEVPRLTTCYPIDWGNDGNQY